MDVARQFSTLAKQWSEHCDRVVFSSDIKDCLNDPAYLGLIKLGQPAIPHIMERYRVDDLPWGFVLDEITGLHMIQDPNDFSPPEVRRKWQEWWAKQKTGPERQTVPK